MTTPATREELVELMARATAQHLGPLAYDDLPADRGERRDRMLNGNADVNDLTKDELSSTMDAALEALEQSGIVLVPVEATEEMTDAINSGRNAPLDDGQIWDDALAASPYKKEPTG